jgi:hypothetical protein
MLVTSVSATRTSEGVTTRDYVSYDSIDGAAKLVAVTWTESASYYSADFVGPPEMVKHYSMVFESHVGKVVDIDSREERIMSDVWDYVTYATVLTDDGEFFTRGVGHGNKATVDASPALLAKYKEHVALAAEWAKRTAARAAAKAEKLEAARLAATPFAGKTVVFTKGRKIPKGTKGTVIWFGTGKKYGYGYGPAPMRVGVKDASGTVHWTAATNVTVVAEA